MSEQTKKYTLDELILEFKRHESDSGSTEIQIVMLSYRISYLTRHLNEFPSDNSAKRSLTQMVHHRRKLLQYLKMNNGSVCKKLVDMIGIRFSA